MGAMRKQRMYRQDDEIYDLMGRLARRLGTNRTTLIEVATRFISERLEPEPDEVPADLRSWLADRAAAIDEERRAMVSRAGVESRLRLAAEREATGE